MKIYHVYYKRQYLQEGQWKDTDYTCQGIVVLAENLKEATDKISVCLSKVEHGGHRAVLTSTITEAYGLDFRHGFENSLYVSPIVCDDESKICFKWREE